MTENLLEGVNSHSLEFCKTLINVLKEAINKENPDEGIIQRAFEFFTKVITYSKNYEEIDLLVSETFGQDFFEIAKFGLLHEKSYLNMFFANNLVKMCKTCFAFSRYALIKYFFTETFKIITNIPKELENCCTEFFEFFSNIYELYFKLEDNEKCEEEKYVQFVAKILEQLNNDLSNESAANFLPLELFVGNIKILTVYY